MVNNNFSWPVTSINLEDYESFGVWFDENKEDLKRKKLVVWGAGIRGTMFSIFLKRKGINEFLFVDSNAQKWGGNIDGVPIISLDEFDTLIKSEAVIILISTENSIDIERELAAKNLQKNKDFFVIKTNLYQAYVNEFVRPYGQNVLIMGDCEFSTISIDDTDYRNLKTLMYERCGKNDIKILAMHGMGLRAHYNIFHAQLINGMKPKRLLLMINFDTLTGKQHLLPRSQHAELMEMLLDVMNNVELEFKDYARLTKERSKKIQLEFFTGAEKKGTATEAKSKNYLRLNYMYNLDVSTEGIVYLLKIIEEASKEKVEVLPFLPPVNYQLARMLFGEEFDQKYLSNVNKIKELLKEKGVEVLDLSYCLDSEKFAVPTTPDETANFCGRKKVADILLDSIMKKGD